MLICAHVALSLGTVYCVHSWALAPVATTPFNDALIAACSLLPDIVDKILWVSRLSRCTRSFGHTLLFTFFTAGTTLLVSNSERAGLVGLAVFSHLVADRACGHVPFFWPLQNFRQKSMVHTNQSRQLIKACDFLAVFYIFFATDIPLRHGSIRVGVSLLCCWQSHSYCGCHHYCPQWTL